jgi:hypothetical protein
MYKIIVFIVVFVSLSIVTVGANLIWNGDSETSGARIGLGNGSVLDLLTTDTELPPELPIYNKLSGGRQPNVGPVEKIQVGPAVKIHRSTFPSAHSEYNYVEFDTHLGPGSNSNMSQLFDVDATQEYIASFLSRPRMNRSGGIGTNGSGGGSAVGTNGSGGGSGGGTNGGGGNGIEGYLNDPVDEIDVADGGNPVIAAVIPDFYPPVGGENPGDFPDDLGKNLLSPRPVNSAAPVPEPATMLLFGAGLASLVGYRLRRRKS